MKLNMSAKEVEQLLGKPDFASPKPAARLSTSPASSSPSCTKQIAYAFEKNSGNTADMSEVALYLFLTADDKLYWAAPQNIPGLQAMGSPAPSTGSKPRSGEEFLPVHLSPLGDTKIRQVRNEVSHRR